MTVKPIERRKLTNKSLIQPNPNNAQKERAIAKKKYFLSQPLSFILCLKSSECFLTKYISTKNKDKEESPKER